MGVAQATAWIRFQRLFGFGTSRSQKVLDEIGHPANFFELPKEELEKYLRLTQAEERRMAEATEDHAERILAFCDDYGCRILTPDDEEYPERLKHIYAPPSVLYVLGSLAGLEDTLAIAMVGTRHNTDYGRRAAESISGELAAQGVTIVSGMAYGIDTICHRAVLRANGRTIAVWGTGIDKPYPAANRELAKAIVQSGGAIVTEFPPGEEPLPFHFPIRNRIIAGLCQGTVVVEGGYHSGSLITAGHALTQNRDVFAVPGGIFASMSQAPNWLISQGAVMARNGGDILKEYEHFIKKVPVSSENGDSPFDNPLGNGYNERKNLDASKTSQSGVQLSLSQCLTDLQRQVYDALGEEPSSSDQIMARCGLPVGTVLAALTQMEIFGLVTVHPGRLFSR